MSRALAILLTVGGLMATMGISAFFLIFAGAAAGNNFAGDQFARFVFPAAAALLAVQAIAAVTLLVLKRHTAAAVVAAGPLVLALVALDLLRMLG